jgi:hypothetical protein
MPVPVWAKVPGRLNQAVVACWLTYASVFMSAVIHDYFIKTVHVYPPAPRMVPQMIMPIPHSKA